MADVKIASLDSPTEYKKRATIMDNHINIIFKMLQDGHSDDTVYFYVLQQGYQGAKSSLQNYIYLIGKNNFPDKPRLSRKWFIEWGYPEDVIVIKQNNLLKYLLTQNPKAKKNETIEKYIDKIKAKYPVAMRTEEIFRSFHSVLMGKNPDQLAGFLDKYRDSEIAAFCNGIEKDIAPVKNAISLSVSSGFVEGNNNKFKLIKRILYGRAGLVNLTKKCKLAFMVKDTSFNLLDLI